MKRILAFTDLHGDFKALDKVKEKAKNADLVLCAGDISVFSMDIKKILKRMDSWGKKIIIVTGNHEEPAELRKHCSNTKNIRLLHGECYEDQSFIIFGMEGNGFATEDKEFKRMANKSIGNIKRSGKRFILLTHAPPYGTLCDLILEEEHCGNISIRRFVEKSRPILHVCGHIHENNNATDTIGTTTVLNPGPEGKTIIFEGDEMQIEHSPTS